MENKIKGGIWGLAVGDALGIATEFMNPNEIKQKYGKLTEIVGGGKFSFEKGEVSDDTEMMMCVANGVFQNSLFPMETIGENFLKWYETNPKDIGITVMYSLEYYKQRQTWENASRWTHELLGERSGGNGSLMRCLPIGMIYKNVKKIDQISKEQSDLTHYDEDTAQTCVHYNRIVNQLLQGVSLKDALENELKGTIYEHFLKEKPTFHPDGYVIHTFAWVIYHLLHTDNYEECMVNCVNEGYDADTVAAIAGGLAGIHYGYESIPKRWITEIKRKKELDEIVKNIIEIRKGTE